MAFAPTVQLGAQETQETGLPFLGAGTGTGTNIGDRVR